MKQGSVMLKDDRGHELSGATPAGRAAWERALALYLNWRTGVDEELELALRESPDFVMARVLKAYTTVCHRDPRRVRQAEALRAVGSGPGATPRERLHVAVVEAALADDFTRVQAHLRRLHDDYPRDVLALHLGHLLDHVTGDRAGMVRRIEAVLPSWSEAVPGFGAVLAMRAFASVEDGRHARAVESGLWALELDPANVRAHHALAHVREMTGESRAGVQWMQHRRRYWADGSTATTHCWWHLALFHLALGETATALGTYDGHVAPAPGADIADLIDAAALLWRLELAGTGAGERWAALAAAWAPHLEDGYCTFSDLHAMVAQVGAGEWTSARRLEARLVASQALPTRYGNTTRVVGLPACRAIMAFGRRDYRGAMRLLQALPVLAQPIGGSHAQRALLCETFGAAARRLQRRTHSIAPGRPAADHPVVAVCGVPG